MTWTQSNITTGVFDSIHNANGIWIAGNISDSTTGLYYSTDGKTWTQSNITKGGFDFVYNTNGIWIASCLQYNSPVRDGLYYSTDGMTWTLSNVQYRFSKLPQYVNGVWVAYSSSGLYYSIGWQPT